MNRAEIDTVLRSVREQRIAILRDDVQPLERAVILMPAEDISTEEVNRLITLSGGVIFAALTMERAESFHLTPMGRPQVSSSDRHAGLNICISVEAREGVTTGISAADRAQTLRILGARDPQPRKLVQPGHIFPIEVRPGGVLVRNALPEGAVDIVTIAGFTATAALIDLLDPAGQLVQGGAIAQFAAEHAIPCIALSDLTRYRLETEKVVYRIAEAKLPTVLAGDLRSYIYKSSIHGGEHVALVKGNIDSAEPTLVRVQPENTFSDVFGGAGASRRQMHAALAAIGQRGRGVLLYLRRTSSGELGQQVSAPAYPERAEPKALMREYGLGAQILRDLGVRKIELLTGSKKSLIGLDSFGIEIVSQTPLPVDLESTPHSRTERQP
jgi:3,4-dihydroxy 2-butanone 4-phosphate synthase/GTP cyclohydrolase II